MAGFFYPFHKILRLLSRKIRHLPKTAGKSTGDDAICVILLTTLIWIQSESEFGASVDKSNRVVFVSSSDPKSSFSSDVWKHANIRKKQVWFLIYLLCSDRIPTHADTAYTAKLTKVIPKSLHQCSVYGYTKLDNECVVRRSLHSYSKIAMQTLKAQNKIVRRSVSIVCVSYTLVYSETLWAQSPFKISLFATYEGNMIPFLWSNFLPLHTFAQASVRNKNGH